MMRRASLPTLSFALITALALLACNDQGRVDSEDDEQRQKASADEQEPAEVDLPSPPPDEAFDIPEKNDDGTFRVEGLIHHQSDHLDDKVEVKGEVVHLLGDCDPAAAKQRGESCPQPHYVITDDEASDKELMVVGFPREFFDEAGVDEGDTATFKGRYATSSGQFVASGSGLIELEEVEGTKVAEK